MRNPEPGWLQFHPEEVVRNLAPNPNSRFSAIQDEDVPRPVQYSLEKTRVLAETKRECTATQVGKAAMDQTVAHHIGGEEG